MPSTAMPIVFISYAHADEPDNPAEGEIKWLSFVTGYLRAAAKHGAIEIWIDALRSTMWSGRSFNPAGASQPLAVAAGF